MKKPMWNSEAVKAYETGQGVELVTTPHPHYRPLPKDLNSDALETVEIELPERTWVGLTDEDKKQIKKEANYHWEMTTGEYADKLQQLTEAKLKEKNT